MVCPLLLGRSLLRYSRTGAGLRRRRSCWLGLPIPFKLGSGAMVVSSSLNPHHPRHYLVDCRHGGMYITTQHSKDTRSETSAYAEASYLRPTSLRYYTPEVHPTTPIGNFVEDVMHGSMR
eukprot:5863648-Pyramimonas_sp.AAC.1